MRLLLHLLTHADVSLAEEMIARQKCLEDCRVEVVDLRMESPDYKELLERIFAADSVEVW